MGQVHRLIGLAIAIGFLLLGVWGVVAWFRNKDPGPNFWRLLAICQGGLLLQVLVGVILFFTGRRMHWLHYAYGAFPILLVVVAHRVSPKLKGLEWVAFSIAGLLIFGLQLRGYMTGFGA